MAKRHGGRNSKGFPQGSNIGLIEFKIPSSPADDDRTSYDFHSDRMLIASLSNHDHDNTDRNIVNLHIHSLFSTLFHGYFLFLFNWQSFSSYPRRDVKWPVLQLCGRDEHLSTNLWLCSSNLQIAHINWNFISGYIFWELDDLERSRKRRSYIFQMYCVKVIVVEVVAYYGAATFLSHGRQPEVSCFPIQHVFTLRQL